MLAKLEQRKNFSVMSLAWLEEDTRNLGVNPSLCFEKYLEATGLDIAISRMG